MQIFKNYRPFFLCLLVLLSYTYSRAQEPENLFAEANKLYQENNYEMASKKYQMLLNSGTESAALYYNLGNAQFQLGQLAAAILYYEKAKRIDPTDKDIAYNLKLANSRVVDKIEVIPNLFFVDWYLQLVQQKGTDFWAYCFSFTFFLGLLLFAFYYLKANRRHKKIFFMAALSSLSLSLCLYFVADSRYQIEHINHQAIGFSDNSYIKSAPSTSSQDVFILHEGSKVSILEQVDGWNEILLSDGKRGWTKETNLKKI